MYLCNYRYHSNNNSEKDIFFLKQAETYLFTSKYPYRAIAKYAISVDTDAAYKPMNLISARSTVILIIAVKNEVLAISADFFNAT